MTQLNKVQDTAKTHTVGGTQSTLGTGTNPEVNHSPTTKLVFAQRRMIMSAVSSSPNRRIVATAAVAGAFCLLLVGSPSYAQTVPAANAQASGIRPLPAKLRAAALFSQ